MPRYKLTLEYDGAGLVGWQRQDNGPSVQEALESAVMGFCGDIVVAVAAGRTDAGVHARGQVAHIDLSRDHDPDTVRDALNAHFRPAAIAVLSAETVAEDFHARFSATKRHYRYRIVNRRSPLTVERGHAWLVQKPLDATAMQAAADALIGQHDFSSFRAAECQAKSPLKTLDALDVTRDGDAIAVTASARSFLHRQVRNLVGSLVLVGEGKWRVGDMARVLAARDRATAGPTAPAEGLYLMAVDYDAP